MLITASDAGAANRIATAVGIAPEDTRSGLDAADHTGAVRVLRAANYQVGVVGNSDSDQPSLGAAHVAFALISGGRLPAERYDVSLLRPGQAGLAKALDWASRTFRLIRYNISLSALVMLAAIPSAMGYVPVHLATALMLSSVAAVGLNGLRNRAG
jgi:cation transport ATPase